VSRVRWQNTYHFVDFHGSVDTLLKYYDAHFYIANWGTVRLGLTAVVTFATVAWNGKRLG